MFWSPRGLQSLVIVEPWAGQRSGQLSLKGDAERGEASMQISFLAALQGRGPLLTPESQNPTWRALSSLRPLVGCSGAKLWGGDFGADRKSKPGLQISPRWGKAQSFNCLRGWAEEEQPHP